MSRIASFVPALRIAGLASLFAASLFAAPAKAEPACPGGGVQKCTYRCRGLNPPVCSYGPPCTCSLQGRPTMGGGALQRSEDMWNRGRR